MLLIIATSLVEFVLHRHESGVEFAPEVANAQNGPDDAWGLRGVLAAAVPAARRVGDASLLARMLCGAHKLPTKFVGPAPISAGS